ncbi:acetyl-CoA carboxylase biotin carboxyl carrier protein [Thermostaphylospora chromogena]|uniref:Biotin carboxyl carrier protein of acetyl-CoA carboxylase n=1 Tax=Thermostaphylospora chromogena TaxID=35622 RepID=A0A1H1A7M1_9ACTN|nr:biotin/lipoyl-containing protein [Thermostaphylospora chromogena]SDQ35657.1 acetyl-CoA carboxylase biotin carboxyl carrier protein [Thermostaphylospora chromogena]
MTGTPHDPPRDPMAELCRQAALLRGISSDPVRRIRLRSGDMSVEVEWPDVSGSRQPAREKADGAAGGADDAARTAEEPPGGAGDEDGAHYVRAPVVGTFYTAPQPGAEPFVKEGDTVVAGQQIGIVEAMKLMNAVEADRPGRVWKILLPDATPVEYGQPLVALIPT